MFDLNVGANNHSPSSLAGMKICPTILKFTIADQCGCLAMITPNLVHIL
jgi:hypothetical protein